MSRFRALVFAAALMTLLVRSGEAAPPNRPVELGLDFGVEMLQAHGQTAWELSVPGGGGLLSYQTGFRAAFPVSNGNRLEPSIGLSYQSTDQASFYNLRTMVSVLTDLAGAPGGTREYLKLGVGARVLGDESDSDTQFLAGGGLGVSTPVTSHLLTRVELTYHRAFESDQANAVNVFDVRFGFSFLAGGAR